MRSDHAVRDLSHRLRQSVLWAMAVTTTVGCGGKTLPPEAFGSFVETDNRAFGSTLDVRNDGVTLFVRVTLPGVSSPPLECRSAAGVTVAPTMQLDLTCLGETIPYTFEFRESSNDWVVTEDDAAPQIFRR